MRKMIKKYLCILTRKIELIFGFDQTLKEKFVNIILLESLDNISLGNVFVMNVCKFDSLLWDSSK